MRERAPQILSGDPWRPLLEDPRSAAAIGGVADEARARRPKERDIGAALLFTYLDLTFPGRGYHAQAESALDTLGDEVAATPMFPYLFGGFVGTAWLFAHCGRVGAPVDEESLQDVDEALLNLLRKPGENSHYELIAGLVGIGVYFLERLPGAAAQEALALIVGHLAAAAERRGDAVTWLTRPELLPDWQRELAPFGYYNLGLAHGVPGVVAFLAQALACDIAAPQAAGLLRGALSWIRSTRLSPTERSAFTTWIAEGAPRGPSRLAWCYGDLGIAAAFFVAGRALREPAWETEGIALARQATARSPDAGGVRDAGLCHGAAGIGHIANRLYQATGDHTLRDAASRWIHYTLALHRPAGADSTFPVWYESDDEERGWRDDVAFLGGATGVGLALLAATSGVDPQWDRILLLSPLP